MDSKLLLLTFFTAFAGYIGVNGVDKVNVTVYYETLCPDSIAFVTTQLYPAYKNLSQYMNLTLVPYGRATLKPGSDHTSPEYVCRHGELECVGDKAHACVFAGFYTEDVKLMFANCTMSLAKKEHTDYPIQQCLDPTINYTDIFNCTKYGKGALELLKYKSLTEALKPALAGVPAIVFNEKYEKSESDESSKNFKKVFCKYITGTKPEVCNGAISVFSSTTTILTMVMFSVYSALK